MAWIDHDLFDTLKTVFLKDRVKGKIKYSTNKTRRELYKKRRNFMKQLTVASPIKSKKGFTLLHFCPIRCQWGWRCSQRAFQFSGSGSFDSLFLLTSDRLLPHPTTSNAFFGHFSLKHLYKHHGWYRCWHNHHSRGHRKGKLAWKWCIWGN